MLHPPTWLVTRSPERGPRGPHSGGHRSDRL